MNVGATVWPGPPESAVPQRRLVRNAGVLMGNRLLGAGIGLGFWVLAARRFSSAQVGQVSVVSAFVPFLGIVAALGMTETVMRNLAGHRRPAALFRTGARVVIRAALVVSLGAWALNTVLRVSPLLGGLLGLGTVCALVAASALGALTDGVLIAAGRPELLVFENLIGGVAKLGGVWVFAGASGLLLAYGLGLVLTTLVSLGLVLVGLGYRSCQHVVRLARVERTYAATNWLASLASVVPGALIPALVARLEGDTHVAWVTIPMLMAGVMGMIPSVTSQSFFVEASAHSEQLGSLVRHALKVAGGLSAAIGVGAILGAPIVLGVFGSEYRVHATTFLRLVMLGAIVGVPNYFGDAILNVRRDRSAYLITNLVGAVLVVATAVIGLRCGGITGLGLGRIAGQLAYGALVWTLVLRRHAHGVHL